MNAIRNATKLAQRYAYGSFHTGIKMEMPIKHVPDELVASLLGISVEEYHKQPRKQEELAMLACRD